MTKRLRNYNAEYARRISRASAKGLSRSQARGHAKASERQIGQSQPIDDARLQVALRALRTEKRFSDAAKAAKVSAERLRKYAIEGGLIEKSGRRWQAKANLPRRMLLFSDGKSVTVTVGEFAAASEVGRYMAIVSRFLETNKASLLDQFRGVAVRDIKRKSHPFETRPNVLYRLASSSDQTFEQVYRIII